MSDLVERLREYAEDDHERLCQGRCYSCSCGYDDKRDPLMMEAAARIEQLEEALRMIRDYEPERLAWSVGYARAALGEKP